MNRTTRTVPTLRALGILLGACLLGGSAPATAESTHAAFTDAAAARTTVTAGTWGQMVLTYDTAAPGCVPTSPIVLGAGGTVNGVVDWGDGASEALTAGARHTYTGRGTFTVTVSGSFSTYTTPASGSNIECLRSVTRWSSETKTKDLTAAFRGARNLTSIAEIPSGVTNMYLMLQNASSFNQNVNSWDVSQVTNMSGLFLNASTFNQPLNTWKTSKVTNFDGMFMNAVKFNQNINSWDVSNAIRLGDMFNGATVYNQPLNNWNTANTQYMGGIFLSANAFNQPLNNWNTSKVILFDWMFYDARSFNQNISNWSIVGRPSFGNFTSTNTGIYSGGWPASSQPRF